MDSKISIVIPVYNSEKLLPALTARIADVFEENGKSYEVIFVNDSSRDKSWDVLTHLASANKHIVAINLLKNYGQHNAVFCGFHHVTGDYIVTMDDDLQNPPEEIIHLVNKIEEGYDAVFGKFYQKKHGKTRGLGSKIVGYLNHKIFYKPKEITLTNFRIIRREVIERILAYRTVNPYIPGLVLMFSNKIGNVMVEHKKREIGKSNYNLFRILKLVGVILFNYSSFPIRLVSSVGFIISLGSFILGLCYILKNLFFGISVPGWTTVVVLVSFLGGYIILMLGMLGEYLSKINNQMSLNKSFHVKEIVKSE